MTTQFKTVIAVATPVATAIQYLSQSTGQSLELCAAHFVAVSRCPLGIDLVCRCRPTISHRDSPRKACTEGRRAIWTGTGWNGSRRRSVRNLANSKSARTKPIEPRTISRNGPIVANRFRFKRLACPGPSRTLNNYARFVMFGGPISNVLRGHLAIIQSKSAGYVQRRC